MKSGARMNKITIDEQKHIFCSVSAAAYNLGITRQALSVWLKGRDVPRVGSDVDFTKILILRRERPEQQEEDLSDTAKKLRAEVKYKNAKAEQETIKFTQMMNDLIPQEEVAGALDKLFTEIKKEIGRLSGDIRAGIEKIADVEIAADCEEVTNEVIEKVIERLISSKSIAHVETESKKAARHYIKHKT